MLNKIFTVFAFMLLIGGAMAGGSNHTNRLEELQTILSSSSDGGSCKALFADIKKKVGRDVPSIVCNVLVNSKLLSDEYSNVFLGFDALSIEEVKAAYKDVNSADSFFSTYKVNVNFDVGKDRSIVIEEYKEKESLNAEIKNVGGLLPLFKFQGDYIVVNLDSINAEELMIISYGHLANILAPSMSDHIADLVKGFKSGIYKESGGDFIYPPVWEDRKGLQSGKLVMDEYGEVAKP